MIPHHGELRHSVVYDRHGEPIVERVQVPNPPDTPVTGSPSNALEPRVQHVMSNDLICASEDLEIAALVKLVVQNHIGCVPVVDRTGRAIGVVTKSDLVEHLDVLLSHEARTERTRPTITRAKDIMMPLPFTLLESAGLAQAAAMMVLEDVHHVLVVNSVGILVGLVSSKDLVQWMVETDRLSGGR